MPKDLIIYLIIPLFFIDFILIKNYQKQLSLIIKPLLPVFRLILFSIFCISLITFILNKTVYSLDLNNTIISTILITSPLFLLTTFLTKKILIQNIKYLWIIFLPIIWLNFIRNKVTIEMQPLQDDSIQIFYKNSMAVNYNALESSEILSIKKSNHYQKYTFNLPYKNIQSIRINLLSGNSNFKIKSINFHNSLVSSTLIGDNLIQQITSVCQLKTLWVGEKIYYAYSTEKDPSFEIKNIPSLSISTNLKIIITILSSILILLIINIINFLSDKFFKKNLATGTNEKVISNKFFVPIIILIFTWFTFQTFYFSKNIKFGIFPDETDHFTKIKLFSTNETTLQSSFKLLKKDPLKNLFPFYHYSLGKLLALKQINFPNLSEILFLRNINIFFGLINFFISYLLIKEIIKNRLIQLSILIMQTNILMFVFISSSISYDNPINLLSNLSILFLIKLFKNPSQKIFLILLILTNILGCLIKITFIPLSFIEALILLIFIGKIFKNKIIIFLIISLSFFLLWTGRRTISSISNTFIENTKINQSNPYLYNLKDFTVNYIKATKKRTFGILAHKNMFKQHNELIGYNIIFMVSTIILLFNFQEIFKNKKLILISFISIAYLLIQFSYNYSQSYLSSGLFGAALQGRYNFPIITSFLILLNYSLLSKFNNKTKTLIILIISIFFIYNSFFWFLKNSSPEWFF